MKKILLFGILVLFVSVVNAETDLLNLGSYNEGDIPSYGENVVVGQDETTSVKWVTGAENASGNLKRLKYSTNLSGDFELFIKADVSFIGYSGSSEIEIFLIANDEYKIRLEINNNRGYLYADGKSAGNDQSDAWTSGINQVKLKIVNNVAKLYVNDIFSRKITLKPDLTYTQMLVNIKSSNDQLYELTTSGVATGNVTPTTTGEPQTCNTTLVETSPADIPSNILLAEELEKGKQAGIQQCIDNPSSCGINITSTNNTGTIVTTDDCTADYTNGQLHVPCVAVSDPFGGKTIYDIKMQQQSSGFTFDLDMNSVKPR
ncbi:MAG: hypothetical protein QM487_10620 [Candidatus Marithrix sp.]